MVDLGLLIHTEVCRKLNLRSSRKNGFRNISRIKGLVQELKFARPYPARRERSQQKTRNVPRP